MIFPWEQARRRRVAEEEKRQALHLEHLKALQATTNEALRSLLESSSQARREAASAAEAADLRVTRDREAYLAALTAIRDVAEGNNQVLGGLTAAVQSYFELFKHQGDSPKGHAHTDASEWILEQQDTAAQAAALGFPTDLGPEAQLSWVLSQTAKA